MTPKEYLKTLGITLLGTVSDNNSYVVDIKDSNEFGKIFSILERADDLDILEDNQVVTEQGSSLSYESLSTPYLLSLIADFEGDVYSLIVDNIED